jgi:hypothetical protein
MRKVKIRNVNYLKNIIFGMILLASSIYVMVQNNFQLKYLIAIIIASSMIIANLVRAMGKEDTISEVDERDLYNTMKSSKQALKIINFILFVLIEILLVFYTFTKTYLYLIMSITLTSLVVLMFLVILFCNLYYEKHN